MFLLEGAPLIRCLVPLVYEHEFARYSKRDPYFNMNLAKDEEADRPPNFNDCKQVKHLLVFLEVLFLF